GRHLDAADADADGARVLAEEAPGRVEVPDADLTAARLREVRHAHPATLEDHGGMPGDGDELERGLALLRAGDRFAAHEVVELLWRAAAPEERDFYQGLVHVAVAPYQEERGNAVGRRRQLEKAQRRLAGYAPSHLGVDVAALLAWCERSLGGTACGIPPV